MRFGITPLELENVLEVIREGNSLDFSRFDFASIIRHTHASGFSVMELTMDVSYVMPGGLTEQTVQTLQDIKNELGLTFTAHLPLWAIEPASPNEYIRKGSVECLVDAVNLVQPLEPEVYVLHSTGALAAEFCQLQLPAFFSKRITEYFKATSKQSVQEILEQTGIPSQKLALENVQFPFETTWQVAEELNTSVCLDTGHVLAGFSGNSDVLDYLDRYFSRIREIHLHDGGQQQVGEGMIRRYDHQALGTGNLPLDQFLTELQERNYHGILIFELTMKDALKSLKVIHNHLPDFPID